METETEKPAEDKKHHPGVTHLLKLFKYEHLPDNLRNVSVLFSVLANHLADELPSNPETTVALRKLLESKDCAVRALVVG